MRPEKAPLVGEQGSGVAGIASGASAPATAPQRMKRTPENGAPARDSRAADYSCSQFRNRNFRSHISGQTKRCFCWNHRVVGALDARKDRRNGNEPAAPGACRRRAAPRAQSGRSDERAPLIGAQHRRVRPAPVTVPGCSSCVTAALRRLPVARTGMDQPFDEPADASANHHHFHFPTTPATATDARQSFDRFSFRRERISDQS